MAVIAFISHAFPSLVLPTKQEKTQIQFLRSQILLAHILDEKEVFLLFP